jgi:hypothetical protein
MEPSTGQEYEAEYSLGVWRAENPGVRGREQVNRIE